MNNSKSLFSAILKLSFVGIATLASSFSSFASDGDRITQLEREVQALKSRLTNLESLQNKPSINQKPSISPDGWRSLANWRSLKTGMSYEDVRTILGEPARIRGGSIATWSYANRSDVTFVDDKLHSWTEPR